MSEQNKRDAELRQIVTDALVSMVSGVTGLVPPTGPGQIPDFIQAPIDRAVEKIGASLPVGVPDALREAVEYLDDHPLNDIGAGSILHRAMRDALAAAPTVKESLSAAASVPERHFNNCIDARAYIADLFKNCLRRHDFTAYINERLAGDFAFALASWLVDANSNAAPTVKAEQVDMADAYVGAREDLAIWKRRALEAEQKVRHQEQIIDHLTLEAQGETRFGEPSLPAAGSDDLTAVRCQCCATEYPHDSYDAGFIAGSGMCQVCDAAMPPKDLPSAAPAEQPYPHGIAEDLERSDWAPLEALQWYAAGKHFDVADGRTRIIDTGAVASNALKHASLAYLELKGDAELSELRSALSAQQSAPPEFCCKHSYKVAKQAAWDARDLTHCKCDHNEYCEHCWPDDFKEGGKWYNGFEAQQSAPERVSVPRDLLANLISSDHDTKIQAERALYALLASHAEGGKV